MQMTTDELEEVEHRYTNVLLRVMRHDNSISYDGMREVVRDLLLAIIRLEKSARSQQLTPPNTELIKPECESCNGTPVPCGRP